MADLAEQFVNRGSLVQVTAEWLHMKQVAFNDMPQVDLKIDANRLILLDRREDDDLETDMDEWF